MTHLELERAIAGTVGDQRANARQAGGALLAAVVIAAALSLAAATAWRASHLAARQVAARRAVLCARYGALAALAAWPAAFDPTALGRRPPESLTTHVAETHGGGCLIVATAICDDARRTLARRASDEQACLRFSPRPNTLR